MLSRQPQAGQFIAVSQIGGPMLWANTTAAPNAAVSMTRNSILGGASQGGYKVGDIISFKSATHQGSFSQQAAIVVDAVNGGTITQWHFLWGGLYDVTDLPVLSSGDAGPG